MYKPRYVKKILISQKEVEQGIKKAANWINKNYQNHKQKPVILGILKGAIPFFGKLVMNLNFELTFDFIVLSSFRGNIKAVGQPKCVKDLLGTVKGCDVIVVEDVSDTARTLVKLYEHLKKLKAKSIKTVVLIDKPDTRVVDFKPDYACFSIRKNPFLIGYGLDIKEIARNLPYIAEFDKSYLNKI